MKKYRVCAFLMVLSVLFSVFFSACSLLKPDSTVKLLVESPQGEPIAEVYVYAEKYPNGIEPWPGPLLGVTDENGILEYTPEAYGKQNLTFLKYGYTTEGEARRITEGTAPSGIVEVEITRKDVKGNRTIPVQVPSVPFKETQVP